MICQESTSSYPSGRTGTAAGYQAHKRAGEEACKECKNASAARRRASRPKETRTSRERASERAAWRKSALERDPLLDRKSNLKAKFGMTVEDYGRLLEEQGGGCAVCGSKQSGGRHDTFFMVDHDHGCCPGKRSCTKCNFGLGHFDDDPDRLMAAVAYLLSRQNVLTVGRT